MLILISTVSLCVTSLLPIPMPQEKAATIKAAPIVPAAPPADMDVDAVIAAKIKAVRAWLSEQDRANINIDDYRAVVAETFSDLDFSMLDVDQIVNLQGYLSGDLNDRASARLTTLAAGQGVEGAEAAVVLATSNSDDDDALGLALEHPALLEAAGTGTSRAVARLASVLRDMPEETFARHADRIVAVSRAMIDGEPGAVLFAPQFVLAIDEHPDATSAELRDELRASVRERMAVVAAAETDEILRARLERQLLFVDGAYFRGKLLNHTAPALTFLWSDGDDAIASLAQYRGKVVVLDFWATWCGPCVGSFPNMRELVERYQGYEVEFIGLTSPQGRHYPQGADPIDCEDDRDREFELMAGYVGDMEITWRIAFTEQDVFNPDYGVRGIPHVAIVDPEGVVRYNGLHPASPLAAKAEKIDGLLAEANLPTPAPLEATDDE